MPQHNDKSIAKLKANQEAWSLQKSQVEGYDQTFELGDVFHL